MSIWEELDQHVGKEVTIKGYLYKGEENHWIVSDQPHLKSCCLGATHLANHQIMVELPKGKEHQTICIKGTLKKGASFYEMNDITLRKIGGFPYFTTFLIAGACAAVLLLRIVRRARPPLP